MESDPVLKEYVEYLQKFVAEHISFPPIPTLSNGQKESSGHKPNIIKNCDNCTATAEIVLPILKSKIEPLKTACNGIIKRMKPLLELPEDKCEIFLDKWDRFKKKPIPGRVVNGLIGKSDKFKPQYSEKKKEFWIELEPIFVKVKTISNSLDMYRDRAKYLNKMSDISPVHLSLDEPFEDFKKALQSALEITEEIITKNRESEQSTLVLALTKIRQQVLDELPVILFSN